MSELIRRITGAGFATGAQPTKEMKDEPVFTGAPAETTSLPMPLGTQSMFTLAATETLSADHLKTIFPMGAPESYSVGMLPPVPVQLEGFDKAQPRLLVAEPAPIVMPAEVPAAQRSTYDAMLGSLSAAAGQSATSGDIPAPAAVTEAAEPLAPAVERLGAPAVDTSEAAPELPKGLPLVVPGGRTKKSKKERKETKDGKVKAKGPKSRKAICC